MAQIKEPFRLEIEKVFSDEIHGITDEQLDDILSGKISQAEFSQKLSEQIKNKIMATDESIHMESDLELCNYTADVKAKYYREYRGKTTDELEKEMRKLCGVDEKTNLKPEEIFENYHQYISGWVTQMQNKIDRITFLQELEKVPFVLAIYRAKSLKQKYMLTIGKHIYDLLNEMLEFRKQNHPTPTKKYHEALLFAAEAHKNQARKTYHLPYICHPMGVATVLRHAGVTHEDILCVALLHDVLEDTPTMFETLAEKFGERVAGLVQELTNDEDEIKKDNKLVYMQKKLEKLSPDAFLVKCADVYDNLQDHFNVSSMSDLATFQMRVSQIIAVAKTRKLVAIEPIGRLIEKLTQLNEQATKSILIKMGVKPI